MKVPLHLLFPIVAIVVPASDAYSVHKRLSSSAFTGRVSLTTDAARRLSMHRRASMLMYDSATDPPHNHKDSSSPNNMWSALASTERWISDTLNGGPAAGNKGVAGGENPYSRKEVSYVCETSDETAMIVAGIFRQLREARELGESHGATEEDRLLERGSSYTPGTMRQTQVVVIPNSEEFSTSFQVFDNMIQVINQARRNARDYVTDVSLEKLDDKMYGDDDIGERDWSVSVNCAHLHPKFGEKTPEQLLEEMEEEEQEGEVDLNLKAYKERREAARRSPYPTVVLEVKSLPPPDFGEHQLEQPATPQEAAPTSQDDKITSEDIQKLEALFGQSAAMNHPTKELGNDEEDDAFYEAIGKATGIDEISLVTPMILAQNWIVQHDADAFHPNTSAFTVTDTKHVDEGYEFVFNNLAMQASKFLKPDQEPAAAKSGICQYLVMSNFLSSSATSFEKFANEVTKIIDALPGLSGKVHVATFHPEHIMPEKRSPVPIFALEWTTL